MANSFNLAPEPDKRDIFLRLSVLLVDELHVAIQRRISMQFPLRGPRGETVRPGIVHVRPELIALEGSDESPALLIAGDSGVKFKDDAIDPITGNLVFVQDPRVKNKIKLKQLAEEINFFPEELGAKAGILRLNGKDAKDVCAAALSFVHQNPNQHFSVLLALFGNELVKMGSWKMKSLAEREILLQHLIEGVASVFEQPNVMGGKVVFGCGPWPAVEKGNTKGETWSGVVASMAETLAKHMADWRLNVEVSPEIDAIDEKWMFRDGLHFGYHAKAPVTKLFQQWAERAQRIGEQARQPLKQ